MAEGHTDGDSGGGGPQHILQRPAQAEFADLVQPQQSQSEHHEGKSAAIVHPRLAGQGEAQTTPIARVTRLHIRGQDRVGRRDDGAEQDRGS